MVARIQSACVMGLEVYPVLVEATVRRHKENMTIVGLPDTAVRESRERVFSALISSHVSIPLEQLVINLSPADIRKEGALFDLPIALVALASFGFIPEHSLECVVAVGELGLDGSIRGIKGTLVLIDELRQKGYSTFFIPYANRHEADIFHDINIYAVQHLSQVFYHLRGDQSLDRYTPERTDFHFDEYERDMVDVRGHMFAKRALEVAAAGGHNVLMIGAPGSGKTLLASRLPTILPPMSKEEAIETTRIYSVAGRLNGRGLIQTRPFRSPHHTISSVGLAGGGSTPRPGEISLAHNGVLFLDEFPEFPRSVIEVLRQPMEEGKISIVRSSFTTTFPARFMLVASMNPCPCGYLGSVVRPCRCTPGQIRRYMNRISGPILDRIDIFLEIPALTPAELAEQTETELSSVIRQRVCEARQRQMHRYQNESFHNNANIPLRFVEKYCEAEPSALRYLMHMCSEYGWSPRVFHRILRVSRTLADLESSERILERHIQEALLYRQQEPSRTFMKRFM